MFALRRKTSERAPKLTLFYFRLSQLLIGGMSEIDVDDWMKHTDYRGYQVRSLPFPSQLTYRANDPLSSAFRLNSKATRWCSGSGRRSRHGPRRRSRVCYSSPPVPRGFPSTVSRTCKARMDRVGSPWRSEFFTALSMLKSCC